MKTTYLILLSTLMNAPFAMAQGPTADEFLDAYYGHSPVEAAELTTSDLAEVADTQYTTKSEAEALFTNFGLKKIENGKYVLTGTIPTECSKPEMISITAVSTGMGRDDYAGGYKIEDKQGKASACVKKFRETRRCGLSNCVSLSQISPTLTVSDISVEGLTPEQVKALPELKIGLFGYDFTQDISSSEFIRAEELDSKVTFTSPAKLAALAKEAADKARAESIKSNQDAVATCLAGTTDITEGKKSLDALLELGAITEKKYEEDLKKMLEAEFDKDIESAETISLDDRKELLEKLKVWSKVRTSKADAEKIANAQLAIARRLVNEGTDAEIGVTTKDIDEATILMKQTYKIKGLSRTLKKEISTEMENTQFKLAQTATSEGTFTASSCAKIASVYERRAQKFCSPQMKMYLAQQSNNGLSCSSGFGMNPGMVNNYNTGAGVNAGFGMRFSSYRYNQRMNNGMYQQNQQNYNDQECMEAHQAVTTLGQMKFQSDEIRYEKRRESRGGRFAVTQPYSSTFDNYTRVAPNLYSSTPTDWRNTAGVPANNNYWNNNMGANNYTQPPQVFNYNPAFNSTGQVYYQ